MSNDNKKSVIGGLVRTFKIGEVVLLNDNQVIIEIVDVIGNRVRIAIRAPECVDISHGKACDYAKA